MCGSGGGLCVSRGSVRTVCSVAVWVRCVDWEYSVQWQCVQSGSACAVCVQRGSVCAACTVAVRVPVAYRELTVQTGCSL